MRKIKFGLVFFLSSYYSLFSQTIKNNNAGFNIGIVTAFGTHIQRVGFVLEGYYVYQFAQVNASVRLYDSFKNLGPQGEHMEFFSSLGLCFGYGKKTKEVNLFLNSISNQTEYKNSIAYSYNIWFNKIKTSQVTGIIALQFNQFSIITENDIFAKPILDRFRTGAILIQYQDKNIQYAINCTMWTGKMGKTIRNDSLFPYVGYLNTEEGIYSTLSHGLLSAQIKYATDYGQYLQANAGIDAEQVRNAVQNRFIHDLIILPRKCYTPNNCHLPMIDENGNQYLYKKGQRIRKAKMFLNGFSSPNIFY